MNYPATAVRPGVDAGTIRSGTLALALQEPLTAVARLRSRRQLAGDAEAFRSHIKNLLGQADASARSAGYGSETVRLAVYATVAFVDEAVLNSALPAFSEWPQRPLQEELFGEHMAGEVFFENLSTLLARHDSPELADLLEVHLLCLLLGFQGRYGGGRGGDLSALKQTLSDRIVRIRGTGGDLSPDWVLPSDEAVPRTGDPWLVRLMVLTAGAFLISGMLWLIFLLDLR